MNVCITQCLICQACVQKKEWVYTKLQRITLRTEDGPIDVFHQSSAFPPNFIHSLDSCHMMMTALRCRQLGEHL